MTVYRRKGQSVYLMQFEQNGIRAHKSTGKYTEREAILVQERTREKIRMKAESKLPERPVITLEPPATGPVQMTLGEACSRCLKERWQYTKGPEFAYSRAMFMARIIGEDLLLRDIHDGHIKYLVAVLNADGRAAATINRYLASLKTILNMAQREWHAIDRVPSIRMLREPKGRIRIISHEEEARILTLLRSSTKPRASDVHDLVCVLLDTGMRLGEALTLEARDVDFDNGYIHVWFNKSDRPHTIPMTSRVEKIMRERLKEDSRVFLFPQTSVHNVWNWVRDEMGMTEDEQFVIHALRHTCASRMVQAGVDLYSVKEILGHSTIRVTERYAHLSAERLRNAVGALERVPSRDDIIPLPHPPHHQQSTRRDVSHPSGSRRGLQRR